MDELLCFPGDRTKPTIVCLDICPCGARLELREYSAAVRVQVRQIFLAAHEPCEEAERSRLAQAADPRRPR